jgi:gliding motility-associated-like protein
MLIATDYSGNSAFASYNVTVLDTMKPVVVTKTHTVWLDTAAKASMVNVDVIASITDNCGTIDTLCSQYNFTLNDTGWVNIDVYVTDKNGNVTGPVPTKVLVLIRDSDNDSIPDYIEGSDDKDGDGVFDFMDLDSDNDGILDVVENEGKDYLLDLDLDGTPDYKDLDTDNDGIDDVIEVDGNDPDFDGVAGNGPAVVDANGVPTVANGGYPEVFTDADALPDYKDLDADDDGILDSVERGPSKDPVDTDSDGTRDWRDLDSDNDGISDQIETDIDTDGDGTGDWRDLDTDNDGISDQIETDVDTDGDGTGDWRDLDSDNDGISDQIETDRDTDGDGTGDWRDLDTDNDGLGDDIETDFDTDGDGVGDWRDLDVDNDGILDMIENERQSTELDLDGDGTPNYKDLDTDDDTIDDIIEVDGSDPDLDGIAGTGAPVVDANGVPVIAAGGYAEIFTDADALPDYKDIDADEDGILDWIERGPTKFPVDTDSDGKGDWRDLDSDNDGISDEIETDIDTDGDGVGDWRDLDSDDDGISDEIETDVDTDGDGIGDWRDLDSDNDEVDDATEGTGDRDKNNIPDWRDPQVFIPEGFSPNGDGTNDVLYIKGLKNYPQAKLTVFNRWGQIVYESPRGYQNDWDGVYNGKTFSIGQGPLPENVYFLLFEFNGTGEPQFIKDPISGNLYIKR